MSTGLSEYFDIILTNWLLSIAILFILSALVARLLFNNRDKHNTKASHFTSTSENWHSESIETVLCSLETTTDGLSSEEILHRLEKYGPNLLDEVEIRGPFLRFFLNQFHNLLIYVLIVAGIVTVILGHWVDASVILAVVFLNALIGFVQEGKAENALKAIKKMLSASAMVLREGRQISIQADGLVPGDIVLLQSGDKVPADLRLFRTKGLQVQESVLTGESLPVEKNYRYGFTKSRDG